MPFLLLIQNETKNAQREVESKFTLCEEMYGTLDDWLGGEYLCWQYANRDTKILICVL